ncbi:MAG: hypothetical protein JO308_16845 [Verrucomicrobia bacterium]|nr:hypothetical protein [Verrucomicrobiota bacterium]
MNRKREVCVAGITGRFDRTQTRKSGWIGVPSSARTGKVIYRWSREACETLRREGVRKAVSDALAKA